MIKIKNKKLLILSLFLVIAVGGIAFAYFSSNQSTSEPEVKPPENAINLEPATEADNEANNARKEELVKDQSEDRNKNFSTSGSVKPIINNADIYDNNLEVTARVPDILENSGKCTLAVTKNGKTVEQSKTAVPNVSEMSCGLITIPVSKLSKGSWSATVTYSSSKYSGKSDSVSFSVE